MTQPFIVTIDGPAGVGKSTLARRVACALGIAYLDSGAMFRTLARALGEEALSLPGDELAAKLAAFSFSLSGAGEATVLSCNGRPVGSEIRTESVGLLASRFAVLPEVRAALKDAQRALGRRFSLVAEGRDMGTAVFPGAARKLFLDADPEVRAERRRRQLEEAGTPEDPATLVEQIRRRDEMDRNRTIAPLRPATDAVRIDTSGLDIEAVFAAVMRAVGEASGGQGSALHPAGG